MTKNKSTKIDCSQCVNEYIHRNDWRVRANANSSFSAASLVNSLAGKVIANWWLDEVYSKEEGDAHRDEIGRASCRERVCLSV